MCVCARERKKGRERQRQREFYVCAIEIFRMADVLVVCFYNKKSSNSVLRALQFVTTTLHRLALVLCSSNAHQRAVVDN